VAVTKIEWASKVWNPVTGCTKISEGCKHCYAARIAGRKFPKGGFVDRDFSEVRCHPERLTQPSEWRKPQRVFVNSMSDLFHEDVPFEFIFQVFAYMLPMASNKWARHTFMILTKRPQRMAEFIHWMTNRDGLRIEWPLKNIWLGVTAENQQTADERIPILLQIPAAVRFVSVEPMLGAVNLEPYLQYPPLHENYKMTFGVNEFKGLDWIICGGETGPQKRPFKREWIADLYDQCKAAGVPFFDKKDVLGLGLKEFPEVQK
jgi:protein gp37